MNKNIMNKNYMNKNYMNKKMENILAYHRQACKAIKIIKKQKKTKKKTKKIESDKETWQAKRVFRKLSLRRRYICVK
jgi:hypothetical protein